MDESQTTPPASVPAPAAPTPPPVPLTPEEDIAKNKDLAALSYLWILSVVVFFLKKDSPFVRFHARQGVTLFVLSILFMLVPVVSKLLQLLILVGSAFGFMNAAQGKRANLPLIAAISRFDWKQLRADWQMAVAAMGKFWHSIMNHVPKGAPAEKSAATHEASPASAPATPPAASHPAPPAPTPTAPTPVTPEIAPSTPPSAPPITPESHGL